MKISDVYKNKKILVTGAAGTIGKVLIDKLIECDVKEVRGLDNNESELFYLNQTHRKDSRFNGFFADVRDVDRLKYLAKDIDIILHLAALKHVIINELSPFDAVKTNAEGTLNVISAALESPTVTRVMYTSSDKAVNSTNVMGTTKLLGERLMTSAVNMKGSKKIVFSSTRFGNVIGSRGSVAPIFYKQLCEGKNLTITDGRMTRFFMTTQEAVNLVIRATQLAKGGEVFVTKMPVMRILDLASAMVNIFSPYFGRDPSEAELEFIGAKPGEKLYEELMTEEEIARAYELQDMFVIKPAIPPIYEQIDYEHYDLLLSKKIDRPYNSANEHPLSVREIKAFLLNHNVLTDLGFNDEKYYSHLLQGNTHSDAQHTILNPDDNAN